MQTYTDVRLLDLRGALESACAGADRSLETRVIREG